MEIYMKKSIAIVSTLLAALTAIPCAFAQAPVHETIFRFECPNVSGGVPSERLTNYGTSISGMGELNVNGVKKSLPVFKGIPSAGVPLDLSTGGYVHAGTLYNDKTGRVTCLFTSTLGFDAFNVSYVSLNSKAGYIKKSDNSAITVHVFQGLKA